MSKYSFLTKASVGLSLGLSVSFGVLAESNKNPIVATSIKPVTMIVEAIAGDYAKVNQIVSNTASPHDFALRPSDIRKIHQADTVVWVGESLESFMEKVLVNANKFDTSVEWLTLANMTLRDFSEHDHGDHDEHEHEHEHDEHEHEHDEHEHDEHEEHDEHDKHEHEEHADAHNHEGVDPHVWLDPNNAIVLAKAVTKKLSTLSPENQPHYELNLTAFIESVESAKSAINDSLKQQKNSNYMVFHDAYGYFEDRFDIHPVDVITVNPDRKPGAKKISEIQTMIHEGKVQCVFTEPQFNPAIVSVLLEGSEVKTAELDPIGIDIKNGPLAYKNFLLNLEKQIRSCF